jgi:polyphosphate kinase
MCCLRPGIPGLSENISVRSIVGRFLEHSRIYCFSNGGEPVVYLGSADIMARNLDRRVETLFPVEDLALVAQTYGLLQVYLQDTIRARLLQPDGSYRRVRPRRGRPALDSQAFFAEGHELPPE